MKKKNYLYRLAVLVAAMMCALGATAAEAYANYTPSNTTLTFYYCRGLCQLHAVEHDADVLLRQLPQQPHRHHLRLEHGHQQSWLES